MPPPVSAVRPEQAPPRDAAASTDEPRLSELAGLILRAPLRRRRLAAVVFAIAVIATTVTALLVPRVYAVDTKILTQRNLVMPSLGNPRRAVPMESDAPTRAAADVIMGRDNLVAIIKEADLVARWEAERPPVLRLKDRAVAALRPPPTEDDKVRALVAILEKKLYVQADESTIHIGVEWPNPATAYEIVSLAQRNFLAGRSAVEIAVIGDTIAILNVEVGRQREAVDTAFASVVALRRESPPEAALAPAPSASSPAPALRRTVVTSAPAAAPARDPQIASQLEEKRRAIRALDDPRQQRIAELVALRSRLLLTYTEAHPEVRRADAELKLLSVEPPALQTLREEEQALVAQLAAMAAPERPRTIVRYAPRAAASSPVTAIPATPELPVCEDEPELASAKERLLVATRRYEDLMDRVDSARIELQTAQAAFKYRYVVVDPPEVPEKATRPNGAFLVLGGLVLSAALAIFAAAAKDLTSGRFVEAWQVRRKLQLPILAEVEEP
ncbi:MAG: hypothetical protein U0441_25590 [Polyangiaceae bacterium]